MIPNSREAADAIIKLFRENGIEVELIGSLREKAWTNHDIDLHLISPPDSLELKETLSRLLGNPEVVERTDWGGYYYHKTLYGDVDVFFDISDLR